MGNISALILLGEKDTTREEGTGKKNHPGKLAFRINGVRGGSSVVLSE